MPNDSRTRVRFLGLDELEAIHQRLIERFGGTAGMRDRGLLDSALHRPQSGYYADLVEMAAALFESLLMNHPFVDGNKRVAFAVADIFLRLNGFLIETSTDDAYDAIIEALASGGDRFDRLDAWLRTHVRQLP